MLRISKAAAFFMVICSLVKIALPFADENGIIRLSKIIIDIKIVVRQHGRLVQPPDYF